MGSDSYLLQRITLLTDLHLGERVRFFVEGVSGLMEGESPPAPPVQQDPIDLQFAFLDVIPYLTDDEQLTLRAGRFGMSFGAGRLVATRAAVNILFRFDGFEAIYTRPLWEVTAFLTQPAIDSGGIDGEDHHTTFWGLYGTHWFDTPHTLGLDLYYFGIHRENGAYASGTGDEHRHSLGAREFGQWHGWDWDAEQVLQVGSLRKRFNPRVDRRAGFRLHLGRDVAAEDRSKIGRCQRRPQSRRRAFGNFRRALFQIRLL